MFWKNQGHDHFVFLSITAYQMVGIGVKTFFMQICQNCTTISIETSPTFTAIKGRTRKYWYGAPYPSSFHWHEKIKTLPWEPKTAQEISQSKSGKESPCSRCSSGLATSQPPKHLRRYHTTSAKTILNVSGILPDTLAQGFSTQPPSCFDSVTVSFALHRLGTVSLVNQSSTASWQDASQCSSPVPHCHSTRGTSPLNKWRRSACTSPCQPST